MNLAKQTFGKFSMGGIKENVVSCFKRIISFVTALAIVLNLSYGAFDIKADAATITLTGQQIADYFLLRKDDTVAEKSCLNFVRTGFQALGAEESTACCAYVYGNTFCKNTSMTDIPIGADVFFTGSTTEHYGHKCGHIGVYVGNGQIIHAWDGVICLDYITTIHNYNSYDYRGWGYHGNVNVVNSADIGYDFYGYIMHKHTGNYVTLNSDGNVTSNTYTGAENQIWHFRKDSENTSHVLTSIDDSYFLSVDDTSLYNGTNVLGKEWNTSWVIEGDISECILHPLCNSSYSLDVAYASDVSGTNIQVYENTNAKEQIFQIWPLTSPDRGYMDSYYYESIPSGALAYGATGAGVTWIQRCLNNLGYSVEEDGSFGPALQTAVKTFQSDFGLEVDGSVGPITRQKLIDLLAITDYTITAPKLTVTVGSFISVDALEAGNKPVCNYNFNVVYPDGSRTEFRRGKDNHFVFYPKQGAGQYKVYCNINNDCSSYMAMDHNNYITINVVNDISTATVSSIADQTYTGSAIKPAVTVKNGSTTLADGTDYTVAYSNNTNVGTATVTITGKGNYTGTKTVTFKIVAKSASGLTVSSIANQTYTGSAIKPAVTVKNGSTTLTKDVSYTLAYSNNVNVGTATVTITGKGNYTGTKTATFKIVGKSVSNLTVSSIADQTYTGSAIKPAVTIKNGSTTLTKDVSYTLAYSNNVNVGTATVTITGKGNYTGTKTVTFKIVGKSASNFTVSSIADQTYTGSAIKPAVTVKNGSTTLTSGTDYTVSYSNNTNVGTATVTITGKGNYTGTKTVTFKIVGKSASNFTVSSIADQTYTGSAIKPAVTVKNGSTTLTNGTDYTVAYSNNVNVGTATVTITGKGNYTGTKTVTFKIVEKDINKLSISDISNQVYTGSEITPAVTVKFGDIVLTKGIAYDVTYSDNINVGTATIIITGKGNYTGTKTVTFKIVAKSITTCDRVYVSEYDYTGSPIELESLTITVDGVTLKAGTDYTISYSNNTNVGTATATITGVGNYTGTVELAFEILPVEEDKVSAFVERLYTTLLGRSSDPTGKANHVASLNSGKTASDIGAKFVLSTELKNKKLTNREFVKRMYQTFLDRTPSSAEITRWATTLDNGCSYAYILKSFVASAEFKKLAASYGITAGTYTVTEYRDYNEKLTAYVSRMYTKALGRNYDITGLNNNTGRYIKGEKTAAGIAEYFILSKEFKNKNLTDEQFVTTLYNALFDRAPDAGGKSRWLTKMKNGTTREEVLKGFTNAAEFKNLVKSFGL